MSNEKLNDQQLIRREKLENLKKNYYDPFQITKFERNHTTKTFKEKYSSIDKEQLHDNTDKIFIAGRVLAIRQMFGVISDFYGNIQFYLNKKEVSEETLNLFKNYLDIGDIIGIEGTPMKTNTNELTIRIKSFKILSKSLTPLPEKFHGLQDEEIRARRRYLDLIMNEESKKTFVTRSKIINLIRNFLDKKDFIEVETPILQSILGGAAARPFKTFHNTLETNFYLRIATELPLKKLIVGGFDKVYEIGRIFRNEGMDTTHNPEFTSIELYQAYVSMWEIMSLTEELIKHIAKELNLIQIQYKGVNLDFSKPFNKIDMVEFIKKESNVDFNKIQSDEEAIKVAKKHNIELLQHEKNRGHVINKFFEKYCEEKCLQPTFVYNYPIEISPLAKKNPQDTRMTERFELFICGKEFANAFSELNDPIDQKNRFENQLEERKLGNEEANEMDTDYINAMEYGLPPTGGMGLGIDRLVMLFTNQESIRNVLLFPHMRKQK